MATFGKFVWYDLMTTDTDPAKAFYTEALGFKTQDWEGDSGYTMFVAGNEKPLGGVMKLPQEVIDKGAPPHWGAYVSVESVDASLTKAQELGGVVHAPATEIPNIGKFAVIGDPQGAVICLFEGNENDGSAPLDSDDLYLGKVVWHELMTTDPVAGLGFYENLFGWSKTSAMEMPEEMGGTYQMYGHGETSYGGVMRKPDMMPMSAWAIYFHVGEVDAAIARITAKGGQVVNGPMEIPGGKRVAQCVDPQGAGFAIHGD